MDERVKKIFSIQTTSEELDSIIAILDSVEGTTSKNSVYYNDVINVNRVLHRQSANELLIDTSSLLHLCHDLLEDQKMTCEAFKKIRSFIRN